ncbi:hypothetical protein KSX_46080 [Ktedonospora formicarum]|uniref:Uncharacterized protein n=1 Tax=Ktedonospora formicarum TaxID=2778364 RepID=A0A8J3MVE8_9CHLR|nr:hypothetical protein KSX_46080 [Ktedonospora formicarum]
MMGSRDYPQSLQIAATPIRREHIQRTIQRQRVVRLSFSLIIIQLHKRIRLRIYFYASARPHLGYLKKDFSPFPPDSYLKNNAAVMASARTLREHLSMSALAIVQMVY